MPVAYFDAFSGLSGDMTIGAFLDMGMPLTVLEAGLAPLHLEQVELDTAYRVRSGIRATKFTVRAPELHAVDHSHSHEHHPSSGAHSHRPYRVIRTLLAESQLTPGVRERAEKIFHVLAVAEARIHACSVEDVGFHEVGAVDALVDIVGAAICLEHFGVERVLVSELPLGSGLTRSQHGVIPVPAPATVEILRGFPCRLEDGSAELVTPTGAAIVAALAQPGPTPPIAPIRSGYGAGDRELPDRPNLLRVILGEIAAAPTSEGLPASSSELERDEMIVLETNVDDMSPELFEPAVEALFEAGARDVSLSPITMKRGRPGTLIQAIARPTDRDRLSRILLRETSTIGVRAYPVSRVLLARRMDTVSTPYGAISVKIVDLPEGGERVTPEYADCHRAAREHGVPVAAVYEKALREAWKKKET